MRIAIIAAMSRNRVIGDNNQIPWHISADFKRVKQLTTGQTIIMGRKTYESIGKALPNRTNIVVTRQAHYDAPGCMVVHSIDDALQATRTEIAFIFGGQSLYTDTLDRAELMYLTLIEAELTGDTVFPNWDQSQWDVVNKVPQTEGAWRFEFVDLSRKIPASAG